MTARAPLLLISDIDGTLLDDNGALPCTPAELRARLAALANVWQAPMMVGFASSRTLREITVLQRALGVYGPCIAEDGALRASDVSTASNEAQPDGDVVHHGRRTLVVHEHALRADQLRHRMHDAPALARADAAHRSLPELQRLGFRTPASVRRALYGRSHSVLLDPHVWQENDLADLETLSAARGLQLRRGGRWFTLTSAGGKGPALCALRHQFAHRGVSPFVVAIGNEENDHSLLAEADIGFVIRNPHRGPHPVLSALPNAITLTAEGTGGWMEMLDRLPQWAHHAAVRAP